MRNVDYKPYWELVAAVLIRGEQQPEFKTTRLYKKALWLSTPNTLTFEQWIIQTQK